MAPSNFFHKPELALRRAVELQGIHQEDAALTLLHDVLSSRRHRTWSPIYEQIMICYLDLCLEYHKSREAKDGLHQYRNLSQSQAPGSLEKVILYLITKAETACTEAKAYVDAQQLASDNAAAAAAVAAAAAAEATAASSSEDGAIVDTETPSGDDGEDGGHSSGFGGGASPEAILLSTMSIDPAKTQRDSALLLPSLKFLWETYRAVLDILRSNSKLEHVYHAAAQGALRFCRVYHRRMEFRHLCDMLRMHLGNLRQFGASALDEIDGNTLTPGKASNKVGNHTTGIVIRVVLKSDNCFVSLFSSNENRFVVGKVGRQTPLNFISKLDLHN
jgi:translation initiation factor 3 subunit A